MLTMTTRIRDNVLLQLELERRMGSWLGCILLSQNIKHGVGV